MWPTERDDGPVLLRDYEFAHFGFNNRRVVGRLTTVFPRRHLPFFVALPSDFRDHPDGCSRRLRRLLSSRHEHAWFDIHCEERLSFDSAEWTVRPQSSGDVDGCEFARLGFQFPRKGPRNSPLREVFGNSTIAVTGRKTPKAPARNERGVEKRSLPETPTATATKYRPNFTPNRLSPGIVPNIDIFC